MRDFDKIYQNNYWGLEGGGSGTGSMVHTTVSVRKLFSFFIETQNVQTIVDVSVGAMAWWPLILDNFPHVNFYGFDISLSKIQENKERFSEKKNWKFYCEDLVHKQDYPESDFLVCRHTLNHLSSKDVILSIENLKLAKTRFLGLTQHPINQIDKEELMDETLEGCIDYRPINLLDPPISMSPPWMEINDADAENIQIGWERKFSVWKFK
jgi:hypothetical protein